MNKEDYIRYEEQREDLIDRAYAIAKGKLEPRILRGAYFDCGYIEADGVAVQIEVSFCGCCQSDKEVVKVTWEELGL